jgi:CRP-like cAMP-binding protein
MSKHPFQNFLVRYGAGEVIFSDGDLGATMYIVQSGKVLLYRGTNGQKRMLGELGKGDFFGEMSVLEGLPRTSSAEAAETTELIEINSTTFDRMIKGNIEIAIRLMRKLSIRLRAAEQKLEELQVAGPASLPDTAAGPTLQKPMKIETGVRLELPDEPIAYLVKDQETLIGRYDPVTELNPDVDLTEIDLKRSVSRRHARIVRAGDEYSVIEEVGALNGTFVNGTKLVAGQPHSIEDGDQLGVGMVKLVFRL